MHKALLHGPPTYLGGASVSVSQVTSLLKLLFRLLVKQVRALWTDDDNDDQGNAGGLLLLPVHIINIDR